MSSNTEQKWYRGIVKAVPSGDSLLVVAKVKEGLLPPERSLTLSSIMAPRLARRDTSDEPYAWQSREFLRQRCIGKEISFKPEYVFNNREFAAVFMDNSTNLGVEVVRCGWAKVRTGIQNSDYLEDLQKAEEHAKQHNLGIWKKEMDALAIRSIPPSAVGGQSNFNVQSLVEEGKLLAAIVEQVRDGSSFRAYLLPSFQFVQVHLAGAQAPSMGKRASVTPGDENGSMNIAQKLAGSADNEGPQQWAKEAKHFTESRMLHREVRIMPVGTDNFNNLFGLVSYEDADKPMDLSLQLLSQGLAKFHHWSAEMLDDKERMLRMREAELQAKRDRLRIFASYQMPSSDSTATKNEDFIGTVIEVVSADCIVVADDAAPIGSPGAERRINLSSISGIKRDDKLFRESKEFLRTRIIGRKVRVCMEYKRAVENRVIEYGSVFLLSDSNGEGLNVAQMAVENGYAQVVRHRESDERSHYYLQLISAKTSANKKLSSNGATSGHVNDLTINQGAKKDNLHNRARQFLPFLQRAKRLSAIVDFVLSGHRYKLLVPKETCLIFFTLSGVRCPARGEPYSDEALAFMRRRILQRDVEIEVETLDKTGTFLGSLFEAKENVAVALLEAGLAKLQPGFGERITDGHLLIQAEENARKKNLKIWENAAEGPVETMETTKQEILQVQVTELLGGGRFYVQVAKDVRISNIQQQLESLRLIEKVSPVNFQPKKGDLVLAQFSADNSWYRALVANARKGDEYDVFYVDYGNQEAVPLSRLRPIDPSVAGTPGLTLLCSLAYIKVPSLEEDYGEDALMFFSDIVGNGKTMMARVVDRDSSGGRVKGQGTGTCLIVMLQDEDSSKSVNASLLEAGLARLEKVTKWDSTGKRSDIESLLEYQEKARVQRLNIWRYGDVFSDEEDQDSLGPRKGRK